MDATAVVLVTKAIVNQITRAAAIEPVLEPPDSDNLHHLRPFGYLLRLKDNVVSVNGHVISRSGRHVLQSE